MSYPQIVEYHEAVQHPAQAFIDLAKAFYIVSVAELPADNGICQSAQSVSIFVSVQHDGFLWNERNSIWVFIVEARKA